MILFEAGFQNQLLLNPKLSPVEKNGLIELQNEFEKKFGKENFYLIPSSGSSRSADESVKLIALHVDAVLNSAARVNSYFQMKDPAVWALFLPDFHVAGLGVYARAHLSRSQVKKADWQADHLAEQFHHLQPEYTSLVPTQIFDLVVQKIKAPECLKKVFVGGGVLSAQLKAQAQLLGWPIIETYGMTETASMIAVREFSSTDFNILPAVQVRNENDRLCIQCDSLLTASVQKIRDTVFVKEYKNQDWFQTQDRSLILENSGQISLRLLGRDHEYIKILGEGVSLAEIQMHLSDVLTQLQYEMRSYAVIALPEPRKEHELVLVVESHQNLLQQSQVLNAFNQRVRPYEKLTKVLTVTKLPRTELGKLKIEELKSIIFDMK